MLIINKGAKSFISHLRAIYQNNVSYKVLCMQWPSDHLPKKYNLSQHLQSGLRRNIYQFITDK